MEKEALSLTALFSAIREGRGGNNLLGDHIGTPSGVLGAVAATGDGSSRFERRRNKVLQLVLAVFFLQREESNRAKIPWMQMKNFNRTQCIFKPFAPVFPVLNRKRAFRQVPWAMLINYRQQWS